jgi:hypothetical protein
MAKRCCTNTIVDNRQLAEDGLLVSDLKMYTEKLILRQIDQINDYGILFTVRYTYGQHGCTTTWLTKAGNSTTSNFRRHYTKHHKGISIDRRNTLETASALAQQPRTSIADF